MGEMAASSVKGCVMGKNRKHQYDIGQVTLLSMKGNGKLGPTISTKMCKHAAVSQFRYP